MPTRYLYLIKNQGQYQLNMQAPKTDPDVVSQDTIQDLESANISIDFGTPIAIDDWNMFQTWMHHSHQSIYIGFYYDDWNNEFVLDTNTMNIDYHRMLQLLVQDMNHAQIIDIMNLDDTSIEQLIDDHMGGWVKIHMHQIRMLRL